MPLGNGSALALGCQPAVYRNPKGRLHDMPYCELYTLYIKAQALCDLFGTNYKYVGFHKAGLSS